MHRAVLIITVSAMLLLSGMLVFTCFVDVGMRAGVLSAAAGSGGVTVLLWDGVGWEAWVCPGNTGAISASPIPFAVQSVRGLFVPWLAVAVGLGLANMLALVICGRMARRGGRRGADSG
jgi:hypothetical protein